jgi:hypothetical protein
MHFNLGICSSITYQHFHKCTNCTLQGTISICKGRLLIFEEDVQKHLLPAYLTKIWFYPDISDRPLTILELGVYDIDLSCSILLGFWISSQVIVEVNYCQDVPIQYIMKFLAKTVYTKEQ